MYLNYVFIFFLGSFLGWIIEFIYRSITNKRLYNPGFLNGFYLPLYGFGALILYIISSFNIALTYKIILFFVILTLLEYITGIIFIKFFKVKLWDYNDIELNYQGIICLRFSIYWTILAVLYYFFLYDLMYSLSLIAVNNNLILILLFVLTILFIFDLIISFKLLYKLKELHNDLQLKLKNFDYIKFRNKIRRNIKNKKLEKYFLKEYAKNKKKFILELNKLLKN
jgi:uncharacterized membrane protein